MKNSDTPKSSRLCWAGAGLMKAAMLLIITFCLTVPSRIFGAFGFIDNGTQFVVDSGAGLVFKVNKSDGTIPSWVFNGTEYNGPSAKGSHIASGLGSTGTTVTATNLGNIIKVTIQTSSANTVAANLTHYFVVTNGVNNVYMATYLTAEPGVGEFRWITRLNASLLPNGPIPSNTGGGTVIESSDVFSVADGTTRSKYYGDNSTHGKDRALELTYCGATGTGVGVWMIFGNRESSSGGPFFRDIESQWGGTVNTSDQEIYNYMNSGHEQTEAWRTNVLDGPYVLVWNSGSTPTLPVDTSWLGTLGLTGWVGSSGRGTVSGTASGIASGTQGLVGLKNGSAQYWANVDGAGNYTISGVKPGTYAATLYQNELEIATVATVTVSAGTTTTLNLASTWPNPSVVFKIGEWDGTPQGFLNATNILGLSLPNFITMHPQDVRMNSWAPVAFTVGTDPISKFPSIMMRGTNSPTTIRFNLTSSQITNLTLKVGATCAYNSGRPQPTINGTALSFPGASSQPSSRSFTVGTYRGNNVLWTWTVPSANLVVGQNTLTLSPVSGSADLSTWLSAGWVYDCVELDGPSSAPPPPPAAPTGLTATAVSSSQINLSWTASSGATSYNVKRATVSGGPYTTVATGVSATTYNDTGLAASTAYYYVVSAVNAGGESANSAQASATTQAPPPPPAAPTGLTATAASSTQINLSWTASTGATSYNVKRATVSGGPYTTVATGVTGTTYNNTGLTASTTYYYVVSAVNTAGESPNSAQASATTPANPPPPAPTGLTATAGNAQVTLSWTASTGATSYNIKRATVSGGPYTTIATNVTSLSYTNTGLVNGTVYYYVVSAVNANGESANSAQVSATPSAGSLPPAPTGLTATAAGNNSDVRLNWTAVTGATSYKVKRATVNGGPYTVLATPTTNTYTDTTPVQGTTYYYVVSAVNATGEGPNSAQVSIVGP